MAATLCVGPNGDCDGVSLGDCAVRMAKAGADIVGLNCLFGPFVMLDCMKLMKEGLDKAGLKPHLMCQPLGYRVPDAGHFGWINIPEFPYALEPRQITRFEAARYARELMIWVLDTSQAAADSNPILPVKRSEKIVKRLEQWFLVDLSFQQFIF